MKKLSLATTLLIIMCFSASAQVKPEQSERQTSSVTRAQVFKNENKPAGAPSTPVQTLQAHAKQSSLVTTSTSKGSDVTLRENVKAAKLPVAPPVSIAATRTYRIGPLDMLDIQLVNNPTRQSTLFTVLENGLLEYPLAGAPIRVAGLTVAEVAGLLRQRIKIFENPQIAVSVRDFASHKVTITGLVASPGTKALRREAVPLYALLAEAMVLPEAARAMVTRIRRPPMAINLKDPHHAATLITVGDVIKVLGAPPAPTEFFYIGGAINSPGQKPYHSGITLTQAVMASGGVTANAGERVKISRLKNNGRLISRDHNLRRVQLGRAVDPIVKKGDRIEVFGTN